EPRQRFGTAAGGLDVLSLELEHLAQHVEIVLLVVDDEDPAAAPFLLGSPRRFAPGRRGERKGEREEGAFAAAALGLERAAQARHHAPGDRKPQGALPGHARERIEGASYGAVVETVGGDVEAKLE